MPRPEWIEVGRVSRPHGVHGEVRVMPDSDNPDRFAPGSVLRGRARHVGIAEPRLSQQLRLTIETVRGGDDFPIVAFREIGDREAAEGLRGFVLEVRSTELPELPDGEYYAFDLLDLQVRDTRGVVIGRVVDIIESPAHGVLVVQPDSGPEILVPFVEAAVPTVALEGGFLVVEPGFADTSGGSSTATPTG